MGRAERCRARRRPHRAGRPLALGASARPSVYALGVRRAREARKRRRKEEKEEAAAAAGAHVHVPADEVDPLEAEHAGVDGRVGADLPQSQQGADVLRRPFVGGRLWSSEQKGKLRSSGTASS